MKVKMAIYTIGDLHLAFSTNKPMSIFGENWEGHSEKTKNNWISKVKCSDTVVLPGDFSWCTYLEDTYKDFEFLALLPGKKILLKGNHDYWWTTITNMKKFLKDNNFEDIDFLYNNSFLIEDKIIVGTRGWNLLESDNSKKMINRESVRLKLSIENGISKFGEGKEIIVFMHYPPITQNMSSSEFINIMKQYNIKKCFYGHLHGASHNDAVEGIVEGIDFKLVSADYLNFDLFQII